MCLRLLWPRAQVGQSLWGQMDDDTFSQTPAGNTWLQAVVNIAPVFTAARPPPPPSPASASNASSPQAAGSDAPPDYGSEYEGTFNGTGFDYPPEAPTEPPQAPQAPAPPRPRRPAATPTGSPSSTSSTGNLTMFEKRVAQFPQAVAAWSTINATITSVVRGSMRVRVDGSSVRVRVPFRASVRGVCFPSPLLYVRVPGRTWCCCRDGWIVGVHVWLGGWLTLRDASCLTTVMSAHALFRM